MADRFRVDRLVGSGGMATVYQATDVSLGRPVALKLFRADAADPAETERQRGEVAVLARLNHFALVTLFDAGTAVIDGEERTFFVMEFVDGPDLRSRISAGRLPASEVAELGADLAEALHYVHSRGIIHRDIKPANVLLAPSEFPGRSSHAKLADFGIARLLEDTRLTATGALLGTASYLSPEQALGNAIGAPTDVYSLGLVLLECLTGERAFPGTAIESAMARLQRQPEIPAALGQPWTDVLESMLVRDQADRISAGDAAVRLRGLVGIEVALAAETRLFRIEESATATAATERFDVAGDPTDPDALRTLVLPSVAPGTVAPSTVAPASTTTAPTAAPTATPAGSATAAGSQRAQATRSPASGASRTRRMAVWLLAAMLLVIAIVALTFTLQNRAPASTPPSYPAVEGELGTRLQELQESVTP